MRLEFNRITKDSFLWDLVHLSATRLLIILALNINLAQSLPPR